VVNVIAAVASGIAAYWWYRSAQVDYPPTLSGGSPGSAAFVSTAPLVRAVDETSRRNKIAAGWSAVAAVLLAVSAICGAFVL
jgi:hypothetical protein